MTSSPLTRLVTCGLGKTAAPRPFGVRLATWPGGCYRTGVRTIIEDQLRSESTSILREVQSGQSMIVTRNGTAVAELKPVAVPRRFVPRAVIAQAAITAPRIDAARFRADIDALVDQSVDLRSTR